MPQAVRARTLQPPSRQPAAGPSPAATPQIGPAGPYANVLALQKMAGNRAASTCIQAKLVVGDAGDHYEHEADRTADAVMRMPDGTPMAGPAALGAPRVQRLCAACEEEARTQPQRDEEAKRVSRSAERTGALPEITPERESRLLGMKGKGQPLPESVRNFFEPRFGVAFGDVRVHTGAEAADSARAVNARAFAMGSDLVFGTGQYAPESPSGRHLLAHELAHVVQQTGGGAASPTHHASDRDEAGGIPHAAGAYQATPAPAGGQVPMVQRQLPGLGLVPGLDPSTLIGKAWLRLPKTAKASIIDQAIDAALQVVDQFPGKVFLGDLWIFIKEGLLGFYGKLKSAKEDVKIQAIDKVAAIMAGESAEYAKGLLIGLLKGFFLDGALGIFILIWDVIKGLKDLWDFFGRLAQLIDGLPDEIANLLKGFQELGQELAANIGSAIDELKKMVTDPQQAGSFVTTIVEKGKEFAKQGGERMADAILDFFSKPGAEAQIGETAGRVMGVVLWEVLFAVLTAGGGAAVTGAKAGLEAAVQFLKRIAGTVIGGFLKVFEEARVVFSKVVEVVRAAAQYVKGKLAQLGERFAKLLEDIREFFATLLKNCHESVLSCKWPKHHPFPKYLGGLPEQTLKKIPRNLHYRFHAALDAWKGGKYARSLGAAHFAGMNPQTIIRDLREFYRTAEGGIFAKYLPDFEQAVKETMAGGIP